MSDYLASVGASGLSIRVRERPGRPRTAGDDVRFTYVRGQVIPPPVLAETHALVDKLAAELGIAEPPVYWFAPRDEAPVDHRPPWQLCPVDFDFHDAAQADRSCLGGFAVTEPWGPWPRSLWILHSLRGELLRMVVAHECQHLAQDASLSREERERDAERFGMVYVAA